MMTEVNIRKDQLLKFMPLVLFLACFFVSYSPAFHKLMMRWSSGDNNYAYLIVPLFIYLCWERRSRFRFGEFSWSPWGLLPIFLSVGLILLGELGSVETLLYIGIWGCLVGLALLLYGRRIRFLIFPLIVLLFIVPLPPFVNRLLTFKLKIVSSTLTAEMLRTAGISVLQNGNILDLGVGKLQVVDACSGLRSFMSMILISIVIGYFFVNAWWRRMILLLVILPLSIFLNAVRIFVTGLLTANGNLDLAQSFFHDFSGWLLFMIAVCLLVLIAFALKKIGPNETKRPEEDAGGRSVGHVFSTVLFIIPCTLFLVSGWALKEAPSAQAAPGRVSFDYFPMEIGAWKGERNYLSKRILNSLWADDYVSATYHNAGFPNRIYLLIPFYKYQNTRHTAHAPQSCLLGSGWSLLKSEEHMVKATSQRQIKLRTMILAKENTTLLSSYFFLQRGRVITSPWYNKFYLMWDALIHRRTDGALVRVEMTLDSGQSIEDGLFMLEKFVSHLWRILPEYVPT